MTEKDSAFLKELVETPSPSGFEQPAQRVLRRELEPVADELRTDVMGNVIARIAEPREIAQAISEPGQLGVSGEAQLALWRRWVQADRPQAVGGNPSRSLGFAQHCAERRIGGLLHSGAQASEQLGDPLAVCCHLR